MTEYIENLIKAQAEYIRSIIKDGYLFGEPIDTDNTDHLICAAYGIHQNEIYKSWLEMSKKRAIE